MNDFIDSNYILSYHIHLLMVQKVNLSLLTNSAISADATKFMVCAILFVGIQDPLLLIV